ncbi:hypothetical protein F5Y05DRAFT_422532 [Hypoxylon sp. FL0543]|nr:hypothetical protein F5Y05DRAFT_422532 [Hypoxylon sp. FL0543]
MSKPQEPPYAPTTALVGGEPSPAVDDPIAVALLLLFLFSAAAHAAVLRTNKQRRLKFVFSGMLAALCLLRSVSLAARMVWASRPGSVDAAIAASVMTQCGSVLVFIVNLFLAQRVLRAYHPGLGWRRGAACAVWFLTACVLCCLVMGVAATVHGFYTRDPRADRAVQLFAGFYLMFLAFLPVPVVVAAAATRSRRRYHIEKFGTGRWRSKIGLLAFTALVATLGAAFRVGVNFGARPAADPAWYHSKACYYGFNFVTDLVVSTAYLLARFDRRFVVPDGACGPGDYSPILPPTDSRTSLVGKLPLMGSSKPVTMMRPPPALANNAAFFPPLQDMAEIVAPYTLGSPRQCTNDFCTDATNTAVQNTPNTSSSLNRKAMGQTPPSDNTDSTTKNPDPDPNPRCRFIARGRRGVMVRMRILSGADANAPRAPTPAHLIGPPILPDLDLDPDPLSATLLAPWALDSWGFDVRLLGSRSGSLASKSSASSSRSRGGGGGASSGGGNGRNNSRRSNGDGRRRDGASIARSSLESLWNYFTRSGRSVTM